MNLNKTVAVLLALVVVSCSGDPEGLKNVEEFEETMRSRRSIDPLHPVPDLPAWLCDNTSQCPPGEVCHWGLCG